jgi:tRNA-modifying protein YgfZ
MSTGRISSQRRLDEGGTATRATRPMERDRGPLFAVLSGWGITAVRGSDARSWLHDLVTTDVEGLPDRRCRRSLLLTPTGRIRADFRIAAVDGSFLLLQALEQPEPVDAILRPYVLSSDVEVIDISDRSDVVAVLDGSAVGAAPDAVVLSPSVLGPGHDLVVPAGVASARLRDRLRASGLTEADPEDLEARRIRRGEPRMGVDFGPDALPAEAGLEDAIDFTKGCFLGQESVAKVRNLGHPPRVLLHVRSGAPIAPGASVVAGATVVGEVTSAADGPDGVAAIVRIRWDAAWEQLATEAGPLSLQNIE